MFHRDNFLDNLKVHPGESCAISNFVEWLFFKVLRLQPWELMRNGVAAFNGVLVGTVISSLYPTVYNVEMDVKMWIFICLGAIMR